MATYDTISCKEIVRKVMRDLKPDDGNWIYDAVEWTGEALEHVGAGAHVESKGCILDVKDFKAALPADVYYINQVAINQTEQEMAIRSKIQALQEDLKEFLGLQTQIGSTIVSSLSLLADGTISSDLTDAKVDTLSNVTKALLPSVNKFRVDAAVIYNAYMHPDTGTLTPLKYCTTNFPRGIHCDDCVNEHTHATPECYLIENNMMKTSFEEGKICLSYTAFATDADCWPVIPNDISFKEAMFWYIYKKLLLSGMVDPNNNGLSYDFADSKWKYYCTQARNEAKYPDIARYESFMNQWVRLIPRINLYDDGFEELGDRENLYRGNYSVRSTR
tara:strand:+ start:800 stop:1795 length:996 start_codon:yes stop_codon:yes gene_type:complete